MKKLSIIIPVYNVELYLEKCVDSILKQNISNYEIVLVNDGSTDFSGEICNKYSNKYEFIKVIHKENGGLSDARNAGIKIATGEYLMFVDGDDYLNEQVDLKVLIKFLKYDVIQYKMVYYFEVIDKKTYLKDLTLDKTNNVIEQLNSKVINGELSVSACDKIVKREIIVNNDLYFEKGLLSEDIDWSLRLYMKVNSIYTTNLNIYMYRQNREGSITNATKSIKSIESLYSIIYKWKNYNYSSLEIKDIYLNYLAYQYAILITISNKKECPSELRKKIFSMKDILNYSKNKKVKLTKFVINIFGMRLGIYLLKIYLKLKKRGLVKL